MTAIVLAGGLGTRLRSAVADRPKVLALVAGRPFLAYLLEQIEMAGIRRAIICTGHMGEQVRETFRDRFEGLKLEYSQETQPLGTGGALALAVARCEGGRFLAMNGDSYCRVDIQQFAMAHARRGAAASMLLTEVADGSRFGQVRATADGKILSFEEKGADRGSGLINAGVYLIERPLLAATRRDQATSLEREIFPRWIGRGLYAYLSAGPFIDIGTPHSYGQAHQFFAREKAA